MTTETNQLLEWKQQIEDEKLERAGKVANLETAINNLKEDFDCEDTISAKKELVVLNRKLAKKNELLANGIDDIKEKYPWKS